VRCSSVELWGFELQASVVTFFSAIVASEQATVVSVELLLIAAARRVNCNTILSNFGKS
jgi:hypothetical protein